MIKGKRNASARMIDRDICDARLEELGLTGTEMSLMCGRGRNWYAALRQNKTTPEAIELLAKNLGLSVDRILKQEKPEQMEIPTEDVKPAEIGDFAPLNAELVSYIADIAQSLRKLCADMEENATAFNFQIAEAVNAFKTAAESNAVPISCAVDGESVDTENVKAAKEILFAMTTGNGECRAEKFVKACNNRGITPAERVRAMDGSAAQFQWRTNKGGARVCYIVRGC